MESLLPGTEVLARGLRWEVVSVQPAGDPGLYRLRCSEGALLAAQPGRLRIARYQRDLTLNEQLPHPVLDLTGLTDDALASPADEAEPEALPLAAEPGKVDDAPSPSRKSHASTSPIRLPYMRKFLENVLRTRRSIYWLRCH